MSRIRSSTLRVVRWAWCSSSETGRIQRGYLLFNPGELSPNADGVNHSTRHRFARLVSQVLPQSLEIPGGRRCKDAGHQPFVARAALPRALMSAASRRPDGREYSMPSPRVMSPNPTCTSARRRARSSPRAFWVRGEAPRDSPHDRPHGVESPTSRLARVTSRPFRGLPWAQGGGFSLRLGRAFASDGQVACRGRSGARPLGAAALH
jgi:hypothetical protein